MHRALEATGTTNGIAPGPEWKSAQHAKTFARENYEGVDDDADSNYDRMLITTTMVVMNMLMTDMMLTPMRTTKMLTTMRTTTTMAMIGPICTKQVLRKH